MRRTIVGARMLALVAAWLLVGAPGLVADERMADDGTLPFYYGISQYYEAPGDEVMAIRNQVAPEEVPVVFHIARRAGVAPSEVVEVRLAGRSWLEVGHRFGVGPGTYYVPLERAPGPPYGNAWGHYRNRPEREWDAIRLTDRELVDLVNLRFLTDFYEVDRHHVIDRRSKGHDHVAIARDVSTKRDRREIDRWLVHDRPVDRVTDHRPHRRKARDRDHRDGRNVHDRRKHDRRAHDRDGDGKGRRGHDRDGDGKGRRGHDRDGDGRL